MKEVPLIRETSIFSAVKLAELFCAKVTTRWLFNFSSFAQNNSANLTAEKIEVSLIKGTSFILKTPNGERQITSPLVGKPHVYNMLAATAVAVELGYDLDIISDGLKTCVGAPGRFERVSHDGDFAVIVD